MGDPLAPTLRRSGGEQRRGEESPAHNCLKSPGREARPPARRAYGPEGIEEKTASTFTSANFISEQFRGTHLPDEPPYFNYHVNPVILSKGFYNGKSHKRN